MSNQVISDSGIGDNPENHQSFDRLIELTRASLIQQQSAARKQAEAAQETVRALGMQIAALDNIKNKNMVQCK